MKKVNDMGSQLLDLKNEIKSVLEGAGVYTDAMQFQVELMAGDLLAYRKLRAAMLDCDEILIQEGGEKNPRTALNPIFDAINKAAKQLRDDISSLLMNAKDSGMKPQKKNDALGKLMDNIESIND